MEFFFIFLFSKDLNGHVEIQRLEKPYVTAESCVTASGTVFDLMKKENPNVIGALCYTLAELNDSSYLPMKRPL